MGETFMKKLILSLVAALSITTSAYGQVTLGTGYGKEKISDTLSVDLFQVQGLYRFDSGLTLGGMIMKGFPDLNGVANEDRYEAILGYTTRVNKFSPYAFISKGLRDYIDSPKSSVDYYTIKLGTKYNLTDKIYTDLNYRFRDTKDIAWKTNTYTAGVGYNISPKLSIGINKGWQRGDYDSEITSINFITRF